MRMNKKNIADFFTRFTRKRIITLILFLVLVLVINYWIIFSFSTPSFPYTLHSLHFPDDRQLLCQFSGELAYDERDLVGKRERNSYHILGTLRGIPFPHYKGISYRFTFDNITIRDKRKKLIMHYEHNKNYSRLYQTDPSWSEEERTAIYSAFHIDISHNQTAFDRSLLQQRFTLLISKQGQIKEISLPSPLRNALYSNMQRHAFAFPLQEFFSHPEALPPLFSDSPSHHVWRTEGFFLIPLVSHHRITNRQASSLDILSTIVPASTSEEQSLLDNRAWVQNHKKNIDFPRAEIRWQYDEAREMITKLNFNFNLLFSEELLQASSLFSYTVNLSTKFYFEDNSLIVNLEPL